MAKDFFLSKETVVMEYLRPLPCSYCGTAPNIHYYREALNPEESVFYVECNRCYSRSIPETEENDAIINWNIANDKDLSQFPVYLVNDIKNHHLQTGEFSTSLHYFQILAEGLAKHQFSKIFCSFFRYAAKKSGLLHWNAMVILSELKTERLDTWAANLAYEAMLRDELDIAELGIRCFENWENKEWASFVKSFLERVKDPFLREYASDVLAELS